MLNVLFTFLFVLPCYSHRHLVLCFEGGHTSPSSISVFLRSAASHLSVNTEVVLFVEPPYVNQLRSYFQPLLIPSTSSATFTFQSFTKAGSPNVEGLPHAAYRFFVYRTFLLKYQNLYDKVLLIDTRDVVFQGDPFVGIGQDMLYAFYESKGKRIHNSQVNRLGLLMCYSPRLAAQWKDRYIVNSGQVMGSVGPVLKALDLQTHEILRRWRLCVKEGSVSTSAQIMLQETAKHMLDQAIFTWVVYRGYNSSIAFFYNEQEDSPVFLMALVSLKKYQWTAGGLLIRPTGGTPAILHQYDRHPALFLYYHYLYNATPAPRLHFVRRLRLWGRLPPTGANGTIHIKLPQNCSAPPTRMNLCIV
eukprot:NODE_795_length_1343_cov_95.673107_g581_i0.p1 GENE.NODE_795_length_1343_cov_95.673107_g581_i0~~NODE_795_length_1343_cov_95.673107_g581_i0.p1  ORF type:complete len:360 (+),score=18.94 NODE_795_length_1343_cov_95.673107_g581_i0:134-1213(+)